jgi:hypothetical protein
MSIQAISNASTPQLSAKVKEVKPDADQAAAANQRTAAPQTQPKDTVQVSSAAKQALQEATETAAQTAKEAQSGDLQAKRLLAKETAANAAKEPSNPASEGAEKLLK